MRLRRLFLCLPTFPSPFESTFSRKIVRGINRHRWSGWWHDCSYIIVVIACSCVHYQSVNWPLSPRVTITERTFLHHMNADMQKDDQRSRFQYCLQSPNEIMSVSPCCPSGRVFNRMENLARGIPLWATWHFYHKSNTDVVSGSSLLQYLEWGDTEFSFACVHSSTSLTGGLSCLNTRSASPSTKSHQKL